MNPTHIDLFRAVIRFGGITRAADALGVGQPHVSRAIAQLEAEAGFRLFVRGKGVATPTVEGEAFAHEVERTYAGLDHLRQAARRIRDVGTGSLIVAAQPSLVTHQLPRAIQRLVERHPSVRVAVHVPTPDVTWSWAASGQCDFGLTRPREGFNGVASDLFLQVEAVCCLPLAHPLVKRRHLSPSDLEGQDLIAGAPGEFQDSVATLLRQFGVSATFTHVAQYTAARCGLVAAGLGIAVIDPIAAQDVKHLPVVIRELRPSVSIKTVLVRPSSRPLSLMAEQLVRLLEEERDQLQTV